MNALAMSEAPAPQAPIEPLVAALLLADPGATVVARTDGSTVVRIGEPGSAHTHALLIDGRDLDFLEQAVEATQVKPGQTLHVVAVGGDASAGELLKRLIKPAMLQVRASKHAYVWTPGGKLETVRGLGSAVIAKAVKRLESGEAIDLATVTRERTLPLPRSSAGVATTSIVPGMSGPKTDFRIMAAYAPAVPMILWPQACPKPGRASISAVNVTRGPFADGP